MFWLHCGLFVLVIAVSGFISSLADITSKREADYTLDDSFWKEEETPVGEVERLLREYRQNQELVRNIGNHYYQIIYPVQLRHHEKMGISTREVGVSKFPQRGYGEGYQNSRGRMRTGRHFHRTSLLIKAFNHKFRLDLELNTQLLAPNLMQKDFLVGDAESMSKQEIEHCYYHGTVRDYPGASAAFHTCNGVSGVIHLGNETFVIHPFYGGDLSKHPHIIFEARTKANKGCANTGNFDRRKSRRQKHILSSGLSEAVSDRYKRDVRDATKYIETAIVIDKAMFDKRNGSTRAEVVHDAIQVANIADLYFRTLNTRVSVVYIETWQGSNQAQIDQADIGQALLNFNDYTMRRMFQISQDTTQLLTGETFSGGESGVAVPSTVCSQKSVGISVDLNTYEPHLLAGTMAHMIGHNIGMSHDDGRNDCNCRDWHGCIMAQSIVGLENVQPYKFSECSKTDYIEALRSGNGLCLFNKPNELEIRRSCGNRVIDDGEQCDCGSIDECHEYDPCCDPITCKLTTEAECATGPCCSNCKLRASGVVCRESTNECDLPEVCSGDTGQCPPDVHKKNGNPCSNNASHCFNGICPALDLQCEQVWGYGGIAADQKCFEQFNSKGSINGHCGTDASGHFIKCEAENVRCGSLQCQQGSKQPVIEGMKDYYTRTIISIKKEEFECKATRGKVEGSDMPGWGLVRDGTSCGDNLICINQTCTSLFPHIDQEKCPSNIGDIECSGHGVCTNVNKCFCNPGWSGTDCSIVQSIPTPSTTSTLEPVNKPDNKMVKKETPYENYHGSNTVFLVGMLMSVVGGVFVVFALMALCYRSVVVHKNFSLCLRRKSTVPKYDPPYSNRPQQRTFSSGNHHAEDAALDSVNKILTFGRMPQYREHKPQPKRHGVEEEDGGTGAEEVVSFIDLPSNNLTKLPEKGILKKHGGYGLGGGAIEQVERTLNQLDGYRDDIIEVLKNAASRRDHAGTPSGLDDDPIRKSLADCGYDMYRKDIDGQDNGMHNGQEDDEDEVELQPPCGTIRIRNLEDIIRQLEHRAASRPFITGQMSPSGSEEIRMTDGDPDRHYRIDSSVCSESSQGSRRCSRGRDEDASRFVYGRYRQPTSRSPYGNHQHTHQHSHQMHPEDEGIYETADPDRGSNTRGETPDCESDAFIQAQQQVARWTNEDGGGGVQHRPPQQPPPPSAMQLPMPQQTTQQQQQAQQQQQQQQPVEQLPIKQRGYYPPPLQIENNLDTSNNAEVESAQSHQQQKTLSDVRGIDVNNHLPNINKCPLDDDFSLECNIMNNGSPKEIITNNTSDNENTALLPPTHFPEYKH